MLAMCQMSNLASTASRRSELISLGDLIASPIFPENTASLALHRAAGFRVVGTRERIGCHRGRWRDVILIERRSPVV